MFSLPKKVVIPLTIHTVLFVLVILGVVTRDIVPFWTLGLLVWAAVAPAETTIPFFVAAIPLFIAIPITPNYDNLTMWRPLSIVVFLRWFFVSYGRDDLLSAFRWLRGNIIDVPRKYPLGSSLVLFGGLAGASLIVAGDVGVGIRRIILLANAVLIPIVVFAKIQNSRRLGEHIVSAVAITAVTVTLAACIQLASTYVIDIYQFMYIWGEGIQLRQFGTLWSDIAVRLGNTWFAYYGPQLSLRVFSLFPDSHSFPIFLILSVAGLMAYSVKTLLRNAGGRTSYRLLMSVRSNLGVMLIPLALLAVILSGTRGIWAAAAGLPLVALIIWLSLKSAPERRGLWLWLSTFIVVFALLFAVAYPIFTSPQFLLSKGDFSLFGARIRSIIDFGETSNHMRLQIWRMTIDSIVERPLLGVGIGNFPVVLDQHVFLARAGSTAHNIYLHIAAEMGVFALGIWIWFWAALYRYTFRLFTSGTDPFWLGYDGWLLFALPWVAAYLLTDAALFDERALLIFATMTAVTAGRLNWNHV